MGEEAGMADEAELDKAVEAFHDALDENPYFIHGREGQWVDGTSTAVVEALLAAGWKPPADRSLLARVVEVYFRDVEGETVAEEDRNVNDRDAELDDLMNQARTWLAP